MTKYNEKIVVFSIEDFLQENTQLLATKDEPNITEEIPDKIIQQEPEEDSINNTIEDGIPVVENSYHIEGVSNILESYLLEAEEDDMSMDMSDDNADSGEGDKEDTGDVSGEDSGGDNMDMTGDMGDDDGGTGETGDDMGDNSGSDDEYGEQDNNSPDQRIKNYTIIDQIITCFKTLDLIKTRLSIYRPIDQTEEDTFAILTREIEESKKYISQYLEFKAYFQEPTKNYSFLLKIKGIIESVNNTMEIIVKSRDKNLTKK